MSHLIAYSTQSGDSRQGDCPATQDIEPGGVTFLLRFKGEYDGQLVIGDHVLEATWMTDDPSDGYVARVEIDCGYTEGDRTHHVKYIITDYGDRAEVIRDSATTRDTSPGSGNEDACPYVGGDVDEREFFSVGPFLRFMQNKVLAEYYEAREKRSS